MLGTRSRPLLLPRFITLFLSFEHTIPCSIHTKHTPKLTKRETVKSFLLTMQMLSSSLLPTQALTTFSPRLTIYPSPNLPSPFSKTPSLSLRRRILSTHICNAGKNCLHEEGVEKVEEEGGQKKHEVLMYSVSPLPLLFFAALPVAKTVQSLFGPFVEIIKALNLPDWLVHWGHPGNMAVVLFAMGGYGTYLGFRIRFSDDVEEKAMAKDLHPKLLAGMFFFFALGATGGVTSLLTSDKPIFESPHAVTGLVGLSLLTIQTVLPALFEGNPGLRNIHGLLGSGIMALFLVHAALGLQLGLSY